MTSIKQSLTDLRKELHRNPEVSGNEKETSERVISFLEKFEPDSILTNVGGYGIVATWDSGKEGREIVVRAELDALPIAEINSFEHKSVHEGVSHKCGHDGHAVILCGVAAKIFERRPANGKVHLLFQPAEENGEGARAMLADEKFADINPDYIFALHNLPGYPMHEVVVREGTFTASVNSIIINLHGKTSHAAEPEHGYNPALAVSKIIESSLKLANNHPDKEDMRVITPVYIHLGEKAYGISAGHASVHLTLRCWTDDHLRKLEKEIESLSQKIAEAEQLKVWFGYTQTFHANVNDKGAVRILRNAVEELKLPVVERAYPFKWGEDFGLFTSRFRGCMFGLGSGINTPALHNPDYDFPDELIETGASLFYQIILSALNEK